MIIPHTPAPWKIGVLVEQKALGVFDKEAKEDGLKVHAVCLVSPVETISDTDRANAALISASPELLAALQHAKVLIKAWHGPIAWDIYDQYSPEMKQINDAIKKAQYEKKEPNTTN